MLLLGQSGCVIGYHSGRKLFFRICKFSRNINGIALKPGFFEQIIIEFPRDTSISKNKLQYKFREENLLGLFRKTPSGDSIARHLVKNNETDYFKENTTFSVYFYKVFSEE